VVNALPADAQRVFSAPGDARGRGRLRVTYRIVGVDEFDLAKNWISVDSPVARALLKRTLDEEFTVHTPGGEVRYWVVDVRYELEN